MLQRAAVSRYGELAGREVRTIAPKILLSGTFGFCRSEDRNGNRAECGERETCQGKPFEPRHRRVAEPHDSDDGRCRGFTDNQCRGRPVDRPELQRHRVQVETCGSGNGDNPGRRVGEHGGHRER